jgi:hypothetical protein
VYARVLRLVEKNVALRKMVLRAENSILLSYEFHDLAARP